MLSHPKPTVRDTAAGGICAALHASELAAAAGLEQVCADSKPVRVALLKAWLAEHRAQLNAALAYLRLEPPSWYEVPPEAPRQEVEVSMERRFERWLMMLQGHNPVSIHDRFAAMGLRGMEPDSEAILDSICGKAAARRKVLDDDYVRIANEARVQNLDVDPAILPERAKQYQQIVTGAFSDLENQLPAEAWRQLQEFLKRIPLHEYVPKGPNPFFSATPAAVRSKP